jgi:hypothetical protein
VSEGKGENLLVGFLDLHGISLYYQAASQTQENSQENSLKPDHFSHLPKSASAPRSALSSLPLLFPVSYLFAQFIT